jgi:hypothetical protein
MLLGELIRALRDGTMPVDAAGLAADPARAARLAAAAVSDAASLGAYAEQAMRRFAGAASHEDWLALMAALQRADDPARACLAWIIDWSLDGDAASGSNRAR